MPAAVPRQRCFIGIGSNLEQPRRQVEAAVAALAQLPGSKLVTHSPWYGSRAIGPGEQPDYVNGVAELLTALPPHALLDALQAIEAAHGRQRLQRWGARTLDLDILLYGDAVIADDRLSVPHPRLAERAFVVRPLYDIAPELQLPDGSALAALVDCGDSDGLWPLQSSDGE